MQIGFVEWRRLKSADGEIKWLEMEIRAPGVRPFSLKMSKNNQEPNGKRIPDYVLYNRSNQKKDERYRDNRCGGLWMDTTDQGVTYMSGYIESPVFPGGQIRIALFKAKPLYEGEPVAWLYDVVWSPERAEREEQDAAPTYGQRTYTTPGGTQTNVEVQTQPAPGGKPAPQVQVEDDEIPF